MTLSGIPKSLSFAQRRPPSQPPYRSFLYADIFAATYASNLARAAASPCSNSVVDLGVDAVEDLLHVGLGGGEDLLDLGGDLGALGLVLRLGLALRGDQLRDGGALGALHAGDAGGGLGGGLLLALGDGLLLLLAVLGRRRVRVLGGLLLVGQRALELRLAGLRQLLVGDLGVGHLLVGLVLAGLEVDLLGRGGLGHRARCRDRYRLARVSPAGAG